ncbi:hypothetical protein BS78_04G154100 [Paspalum vaginatum]|nr:hypothetical protein BS78_04G154100 [Paspalum vaginatum]
MCVSDSWSWRTHSGHGLGDHGEGVYSPSNSSPSAATNRRTCMVAPGQSLYLPKLLDTKDSKLPNEQAFVVRGCQVVSLAVWASVHFQRQTITGSWLQGQAFQTFPDE